MQAQEAREARTERHEPLGVLVAGAGVAALETVLALRRLAGERVALEVLAPDDRLTYRPLHVPELLRSEPAERISLAPLFAEHGVRYRRGFLSSVDPAAHAVRTGGGQELTYDVLVVACGATRAEAVPGAITVPGLGDAEEVRALLDEIAAGRVRRVAFALPAGAGWPLPLYELALGLSAVLERRGGRRAELVLVTPESDPLGLFGQAASESVRTLLARGGIELVTQTYPVAVERGGLAVRPGGLVPADRVLALPRLEGRRIGGLPRDCDGFVPVDPSGRVTGLEDVFAAGDAVNFPVKQGGIATQQAAVVAGTIAALAGAAVSPQPFRPVLRGLLLTGGAPRYLRSELTGGYGASSLSSLEPLWWPPAKIAGRHLGPALAELVSRQAEGVPADREPEIVESGGSR